MSLPTIRLRQAWNLGGLTFKELGVRTYHAMDEHGTLDRAATVAFYAMLALVPFLGFLLAIGLGLVGGLADQLLTLSHQFLPADANTIVQSQVRKIQQAPPVGLLSVGFLLLLWSASGLFSSVMDALNAAYSVHDSRSWWRRRVSAIILTVVEAILLVGTLTAIVAGPAILNWIGLSSGTAVLVTVVKWVIVLVALLAAFALAYYFGPDVKQEWEWLTPGSTVGVLVLIVASLGLRFYFQYGSNSSETYGVLAGTVLMLLWLYLAALALLIGAEINCVIEHAAPAGRAPGQKVAPQQVSARDAAAPAAR